MKVIERICELIEFMGVSVRQFEHDVGLGNNTIGKAKLRNGGVTTDTLAKIVEHYGDVNLHWLLTGEGDMIKSAMPYAHNIQDSNYANEAPCFNYCPNCQALQRDIERYRSDIERYLNEIERLQDQISNQTATGLIVYRTPLPRGFRDTS